MSHSSLHSLQLSVDLFPVMFPDSDIASRMRMHKDKNAYIVRYGLDPYLQQQLADVLNNCSFYTVSFDESLNKVAQKGQMDIVVRFWNTRNGANNVSTRYLT